MSTSVADLVEAETAAAGKAVAEYERLVDRLASGEEVSQAAALKILREAGKSAKELDAELSRRRRVEELRGIVATLDEARAALEEVQGLQADLKADHAAFEKRFAAQAAELAKEEALYRTRVNNAENAKQELRKICPVPPAEAKWKEEWQKTQREIIDVQRWIGGHSDPDEQLAVAAKWEEKAKALSEEFEKVPALDIFNRSELRHRFHSAIEARDDARGKAERSEGKRHFFKQLKALKARIAELEANRPTPSIPD